MAGTAWLEALLLGGSDRPQLPSLGDIPVGDPCLALSPLGMCGPHQDTAPASAPLLRGPFVLGDFRNAMAGAAAQCRGFWRGSNPGLPPRLRASAVRSSSYFFGSKSLKGETPVGCRKWNAFSHHPVPVQGAQGAGAVLSRGAAQPGRHCHCGLEIRRPPHPSHPSCSCFLLHGSFLG